MIFGFPDATTPLTQNTPAAANVASTGMIQVSWFRFLVQIAQVLGVVSRPGLMAQYAATSPPSGWVQCNGAAISRSGYSSLFAQIGTTFGAGDGSTTFNVPNEASGVTGVIWMIKT